MRRINCKGFPAFRNRVRNVTCVSDAAASHFRNRYQLFEFSYSDRIKRTGFSQHAAMARLLSYTRVAELRAYSSTSELCTILVPKTTWPGRQMTSSKKFRNKSNKLTSKSVQIALLFPVVTYINGRWTSLLYINGIICLSFEWFLDYRRALEATASEHALISRLPFDTNKCVISTYRG